MPRLHARREIVVRPATEDDISAIHRVRITAWRDAYAGIVPDEVLERLRADDWQAIADQRARFRQAVPGTHLLVAETGGGVVGFAAIGPEREAPQPGSAPRTDAQAGEVYAIYVLPSEQGHGIGRALLEAAMDRLGSDGFASATLWVLEANESARAFYDRCGWAPTGERQPVTIGVELPELRYAVALPPDRDG